MTAVQKKRMIALSVFLLFILFVFVILHLDRINEWLGKAMIALRPVLIGLVLAYLANPIFRFFEHKIFVHMRLPTLRRVLALICTYTLLFLILVALVMLIVPQLISSVTEFLNNSKVYLFNAVQNINDLSTKLNQMLPFTIPMLDAEYLWGFLKEYIKNFDLQNLLGGFLTGNNILTAIDTIGTVFSVFTDIVFGLFISLYILASKERQYAQIKRLRKAFLGTAADEKLSNIARVADRSFGGFLRGKILDSSIVGILVYIIISIMQVPYALLIAVIIGITDIVPVIGPFVGVIPSAIIILLTDPLKVIPFLLCILIVQQIDGNIIAPKILGENTGVSSLCVMIAITVLGSLCGLVGMVVAVPLFATVIEIINNFLEKRLQKKGLPVDTEHYYGQKTEARALKPISNPLKKRKKAKKAPLPSPFTGKGSLSDSEKIGLHAYAVARKHDALKSPNKENLAAFAAEITQTVPADSAEP